jgi:hypothetical protein
MRIRMSEDPAPLYQYVSPPLPTESSNWIVARFERITPELPDEIPPDVIEITVSTGVLERIQSGNLAKPLTQARLKELDDS